MTASSEVRFKIPELGEFIGGRDNGRGAGFPAFFFAHAQASPRADVSPPRLGVFRRTVDAAASAVEMEHVPMEGFIIFMSKNNTLIHIARMRVHAMCVFGLKNQEARKKIVTFVTEPKKKTENPAAARVSGLFGKGNI